MKQPLHSKKTKIRNLEIVSSKIPVKTQGLKTYLYRPAVNMRGDCNTLIVNGVDKWFILGLPLSSIFGVEYSFE